MKFGLLFANVGPFAQPDHLTHLARTAEETGFESLWTVEHVEGAARRAARVGDGFFPGKTDPELLKRLISAMRNECERIGRNPAEIELTIGATSRIDADDIARPAGLGADRVTLAPPAVDPEGVRRGLSEFGEQIISNSA